MRTLGAGGVVVFSDEMTFDSSINQDDNRTLGIRAFEWCAFGLVKKVEIDIKPGNGPNCFNNNGHGVIPVAILSSADFDATQVDPTTISLDGQGVRVIGKANLQAHPEDVNGDSLNDLVVQIEDIAGTYEADDTLATLMAETFAGVAIQGEDTICIVP